MTLLWIYSKNWWAIHEKYNGNYLEAEYLFATQSARMAARWEEDSRDADRYDLQYRTAGDDKVRVDHRPLEGITLPAADPFWQEYYPPNGWRCRCTVAKVRRGKYEQTDTNRALMAGRNATEGKLEIFRFNPGKQKAIFPPHHPYYGRQGYGHCTIGDNGQLAANVADNEVCRVYRTLTKMLEESSPQTLKETDAVIREWAKQNSGEIDVSALKTGKLSLRHNSVKRFLAHAKNKESKEMLTVLEAQPERLQFVRFDKLGSNKDMNNPADAKNVKKKAERDVKGYNVYRIDEDDYRYTIGLELIERKGGRVYEQPYYIDRKKKRKTE